MLEGLVPVCNLINPRDPQSCFLVQNRRRMLAGNELHEWSLEATEEMAWSFPGFALLMKRSRYVGHMVALSFQLLARDLCMYQCIIQPKAAEPTNQKLVQALLLPDPDRNGTEPGKLSEVVLDQVRLRHVIPENIAALAMHQYSDEKTLASSHCPTEVQQLKVLKFFTGSCR